MVFVPHRLAYFTLNGENKIYEQDYKGFPNFL